MPRKRKRVIVPKAGSQRRPHVLSFCSEALKTLAELYRTTDPADGENSDEAKLETARQAIVIWWYVWDELALWAQSQLVGYEILKSHPGLRNRIEELIGQDLTIDSYVLEYVGLYFSKRRVNDADPLMAAIHGIMNEEFDITMDSKVLRPIIRSLLDSDSPNSGFWRSPLQNALFSVELGEIHDLVQPDQTRRQGSPVALYHWKLKALSHVQFLVGKGLKKYKAEESVARILGQSVHTLRSWENAYRFDDNFVMDLRAARLAGELEGEFDARPLDEIIEAHSQEYYRFSSDVAHAKRKLEELRAEPLSIVREGLRMARAAKTGL